MARPSFKPTKAQREQVTAARALGMAKEKIALALEIDEKTLSKHFAMELDVGASKCQMNIRSALVKQAMRGNVSAQKFAIGMIDRAAAAAEFEQPEPKAEPLGKKAAAALEAQKAGEGSDWGNDLSPATGRPN